jgi:hypothetical protein
MAAVPSPTTMKPTIAATGVPSASAVANPTEATVTEIRKYRSRPRRTMIEPLAASANAFATDMPA